ATVANVFAYDAFGTLIASNAVPQTDYLFTGEQRDPHLGFYYLRARYLNPGTGRFWTRDTHPGVNEDPISLHRYLYANADPVNRLDPTGRETLAGQLTIGGIWGSLATVQAPAISMAYIRTATLVGTIALTVKGDRADANYVYRRLSETEAASPYMAIGIRARSPGAAVTPQEHILGERNSPWISTSRFFATPLYKYNRNAALPIIKIDLRKLATPYLDFTLPHVLATLTDPQARANALADAEVLIFEFVPANAIVASSTR
ncbi:MAG: RHS repeat-associated core domain-containing protein, partial [Nitrospira sp.]|nr:RHS repeat-associated core domain-containing protein [Nitrospira sp.]